MPEQKLYLDSSALAKRYVEESGSEQMDSVFTEAEKGEASLAFSLWNIGEVAGVLDRYERDGLVDAKAVMRTFLGEMKRLGKARAAGVVPVSGGLMADAISYSLKHHIYVADALQIASCKSSASNRFFTADRRLAEVARDEGIATILVA